MWGWASRLIFHLFRNEKMPSLTPTMHCCCGQHGTSWSVPSISREVAAHITTLLTGSGLSLVDFFSLTHECVCRPVDNLLMMARSSVVPRGGTSPESALHVLTESSGDFLVKSHRLIGPLLLTVS